MNDVFVNAGEVTQTAIIERWKFYYAALKDPSKIGTPELPLHANEYHLGYYRTRHKNSQWEAVGIYPDDNGVDVGFRAGRQVGDLQELFLWSCRYPVTYEAYIKALAGGGFDDEPPAPIGDNSGATDPFEALKIEFDGEKEQAEEFLRKGVKTQEDADKISIWKDRILKIRSRAQAMFKAEKQPILDEEKRIDDKYRALAHAKEGDTTALIEKLRLGLEAFLSAKKAEEEARQRKAREEADRARRAAEEAARKAAESDQQGEREREAAVLEAERQAALARAAEAEAKARTVSAGRTGARTSFRTEKIGIVTDYGKAAASLVAMKHPDFIAEIDRLAQRAAKASMPFDGMEIKEQDKVI